MSKKNKRSKNPNQPKVVVKKKGGFLGKLVALLLGFILGIVALVGGVVGAGYWVVTRPIKQVDDTISNLGADLDLNKYLTDEYYKGTVLDLIGGVSEAVSEIAGGSGTFGSLAKISPEVEKAMDKLAKKLVELGSTLPQDSITSALLETKFSDFGTYLKDSLLGSIQIGNLLVGVQAFPFDTLVNDVMMMSIFYGVEGEDYTIDRENNKILPVEGGKEFLSIGMIMNDGITATLGTIPVDALLTVNEGDGAMCALAYGSSHHYKFVNKKVVMNDLVYTLEKDGFYLDGEKLAATYEKANREVKVDYKLADGKTDEYVLTVTLTDTLNSGEKETSVVSQYLKKQSNSTNAYDVFTSAEMTKKATYSKATLGMLMDSPQDLLESIELASVLGVQADQNPIVITLAYGVEGQDFEYAENGEIQMINGSKPKTIGSLMGGELDSLITELPLASILTDIDHKDGMMMALAYGAESHWYEDDKEKIVMKNVEYTINGSKVYDIDGNLLENTTATPNDNGYTIVKTVGKETVTTYAKQVDKEDYFYEYPTAACVKGEELTYAKTTVGDLQSDPTGLLNAIKLADLMEIKYGETNPVLIALAYGVEGTDYEVINNVITPINPPKTVGSLMSGDLESTVENLPLDALLTIPLDDEMMTALAYGQKGTHFEIDKHDSENVANWEEKMLGSFYVYEQRDGDDKKYFYDRNDEKVTGIVASDKADYTYMQQGDEIKYLKATNKSFPDRYYLFTAEGKEVPFGKITVGQLQKNPDDLINDIELAGVLNIESPLDESASRLMRALAYGNKGTHYDIVNGELVWKNGYGPRTIGSLREGGAIFNDLLIGDALDVKAGAHPVLIAIAYGENYKIPNKLYDKNNVETEFTETEKEGYTYEVSINDTTTVYLKQNDTNKNRYDAYNADGTAIADSYYTLVAGTEIVSNENRTLNDLSGANSMNIINGVSLAAALNVADDKSSDSLMRALAYGTENTHYYFDANGKVTPMPSFYILKDDGKYYDKNNQPVTVTATEKKDAEDALYDGQLTVNGKTVYLKNDNAQFPERYYAYDESNKAVPFAKATIGELSSSGSGLINNVTLADALGITEEDKAKGGLTVSLAYDKDGNPYTIGQLSEDPNAIVNNITLEDSLGLSAASTDKMMTALAYGQKGTHYDIVNKDGKNEIDMKPAFYTMKEGKLYDRFNNEMTVTPTEKTDYAYQLTVDGETVYLKQDTTDATRYYVYDENGNEVEFTKTTIGDLSNNGTGVIHSIPLADALAITEEDKAKGGLTVALAYDKDGNPYTIGQLSENPNAIINNITLEDSLGLSAASTDKMMTALAYGQKGTHYDIDGNVIDMKPAFYTMKEGKLYDRFNNEMTVAPTEKTGYAYQLTVDGETVYLKQDTTDANRYYVYDENGNEVEFAKTTIGDLSNNGTGVIHSVTLADALGVEKGDTTLSGALAFDKEGNPYTIGQLSKDPNAIIDNVQLDKVMTPDSKSALTMYLLYGREHLHYDWDETAKKAVMLEKVMAVHTDDAGNLCLHNEFGEEIKDDTNLTKLDSPQTTTWTDKDGNQDASAKVYYTFTRHGVEHRLLLPSDTTKLPLTESIRLKGKDDYDGYYGVVYYVQYQNETGDWVNELYEPNTIGDLTSGDTSLLSHLTDRLTLVEVLGESQELRGNIFLAPIADTTIGELPKAISELTIAEVFEDDVFDKNTNGEFVATRTLLVPDLSGLTEFQGYPVKYNSDTEESYYYYIDAYGDTVKSGDCVYVNGNKNEPLTIIPSLSGLNTYKGKEVKRDENTGKYYYTDSNYEKVYEGDYVNANGNKTARALVGTWYYLLTDADLTDGYTAPEKYLLTQIADLVKNMTVNIQNASMNELYRNEIIVLDNKNFLTTTIMYKITVPPLINITIYDTDNGDGFYDENSALKTEFGQLTIKEMTSYITTLIAKLSSIGN